MNLAIFCER